MARSDRPGTINIFGVTVDDVDDRLETSDYGRAVVSGAEFEGARAKAALAKTSGEKSSAHGQFDNTGKAVLRGGTCA